MLVFAQVRRSRALMAADQMIWMKMKLEMEERGAGNEEVRFLGGFFFFGPI